MKKKHLKQLKQLEPAVVGSLLVAWGVLLTNSIRLRIQKHLRFRSKTEPELYNK